MNPAYGRSRGVNEALAERMPVATGTDTETFAALYERTFPRVYAYVASLLRDRVGRGGRDRAGFRARLPPAGHLPQRAAAAARRGCSGSRATPRWTSCGGSSAARGSRPSPRTPSALGADDHAELALRREAVRAAMSALDGRERDLLALKFSAGLSNSEIATVLGLSETAAGTRLHRTLTKLRKACNE